MSSAAITQLRVSDAQFKQSIDELAKLVAIPSVSFPTSPDYNLKNFNAAADYVKDSFDALDFTTRLCEMKPDTAPYVLAEKIVDVALPTILLYAHYDVQPVERDKWKTDPFKMEQIGNRLYGRGASDDKAGIIAILTALKVYKEAGQTLPVNVKILIEGDEEYGEALEISELLRLQKKELEANALIIFDGGNRDISSGTVENSTRGVIAFELETRALQKPTHSGVGCLAPDPAMALCKLVTSLSDPKQIPGLLDDCLQLDQKEADSLDSSSVSEEYYAKEHGVVKGATLRGDSKVSVFRRIVEEPSISVINMTSGEKGGSNSIQDSARCKIGVRLTPGQDPKRVSEVIQKYIASQTTLWNVPYTLTQIGLAARSWKGNVHGPYTTALLSSLDEVYGKTAIMPTGGTLPLITDFEEAFPSMEVIIAGVEDPDTSAHSHNESQDISVLRNATDSLISFLDKARNIPLKA